MTGDEEPHEHANCSHVTPANHMPPSVLVIDDKRNDLLGFVAMIAASGLSTVHSHAGQLAAPPIPSVETYPSYPSGRRLSRGKGLLGMMVGLGAEEKREPAPARGSPDPQVNTDVCVKCRMDLFGGARGVMEAERCSWCREFRCGNCDAEHDGIDWHPNHTGDIHCIYYGQ